MGDLGKTPEDRPDPQGSRTTPFIPGLPDLTAGGNSFQPYPMQQDLLLSQQQQGVMWLQRYHDTVMELQADFCLTLHKREDEWYQRYDKKNQEIIGKSVENSTLIVVSSPQFFCYF